MTLRLIQRRKRRDINIEDAEQAYAALLHDPSNAAIDTYVAQFSPPGGGRYMLSAGEYDVARYILSVVHCSYSPAPSQVFLDTLGLRLNHDMDAYRLAMAKLERRMLDRQVTHETKVKAPGSSRPVSQRVLSPLHTTQDDKEARGGQRVQFV